MKIAQVAPLYESVPPLFYGGTERIVSYLTEELVRMNHQVTLFASGDSKTSARLVPCCRRSLRLDKDCVEPLAHHLLMLEQVYRMSNDFDIIHFHVDYLPYSAARRLGFPHVTTLHGRLDIPDLIPLYREFPETPVISISDSQRRPLPWLNWQATIHHGIPAGLLSLNEKGGDYLAFLGRVSPEKGLDKAIEIARRSGMKLKIAAKVDKADFDYYTGVIRPMMNDPLVEFLGEIGEKDKEAFLGNAFALVFPIDWEEPFGLVLIESMACGTPVLAFGRGSVREVVKHGIAGFIVRDVDDAVKAIPAMGTLSRVRCRRYFEQRFSAMRMAEDYVAAYGNIIGSETLQQMKLVNNCRMDRS